MLIMESPKSIAYQYKLHKKEILDVAVNNVPEAVYELQRIVSDSSASDKKFADHMMTLSGIHTYAEVSKYIDTTIAHAVEYDEKHNGK